MCANPLPLHPADTWLQTNTDLKPLHQVCRQHNRLISHSEETPYRRELSRLVQKQQPPSECGEDQGYQCTLQDKTYQACSFDQWWCCCGEGEQHEVPERVHHWTPHLDLQLCINGCEGSTTPVFPRTTEKSGSSSFKHDTLLHRFHREHPHQLYLCVVWCLNHILPQDPAAHSEVSWEAQWCLSPLTPGHLQPVHLQRHQDPG